MKLTDDEIADQLSHTDCGDWMRLLCDLFGSFDGVLHAAVRARVTRERILLDKVDRGEDLSVDDTVYYNALLDAVPLHRLVAPEEPEDSGVAVPESPGDAEADLKKVFGW